MHARPTPSASPRSTPRALSRLLARRATRRQTALQERQLARALAGDFGPGVRADVAAAQYRSAARHRIAA